MLTAMTEKKFLSRLLGRQDRDRRAIEQPRSGRAASHVDFLVLTEQLLHHSKERFKRSNNHSPYVLAGIPILLSMIRALVIDCETMSPNKADIAFLTKGKDIQIILDRYDIEGELRENAEYLIELRHEIIHPMHISITTKDHWPDYLRTLKDKGLLNSSGQESGDYDFFWQMQSHKLFVWAHNVTWEIATQIIARYIKTADNGTILYGAFMHNFTGSH